MMRAEKVAEFVRLFRPIRDPRKSRTVVEYLKELARQDKPERESKPRDPPAA